MTNLQASGPGSLREAVEAEGKRVVVFEVGGVIDLQKTYIRLKHPFITIAGQTAPEPGITVIRGGLRIVSHDVLVQHLAIRPGDAGMASKSGWEPDACNVGASHDRDVYNVVVDHCSFTWSVDENASVSGQDPQPHDVTYANCIIAEGLSHATHTKGEHSRGTLIHDGVKNVSLIGNLYAHNFRRNPLSKTGTSLLMANNLIYNPGQLGPQFSNFGRGEKAIPQVSILSNVFQSGPNTPKGLSLVSVLGGPFNIHVRQSLAFDLAGNAIGMVTASEEDSQVGRWSPRHAHAIRVDADEPLPIWVPGLKMVELDRVEAVVLSSAGMRPAARNSIDARIIGDVRARKGSIIDSQDQVGGYPTAKETKITHKLPEKPKRDDDQDGYTNLEEWLHQLARALEP
ncbi:MAG: right-handed parallel beta-helix repeat-containing protein [Verrucomicrobia bacterium]|nr:right-handed parallel beta-helix repeat-containing protein [Verrucomicrobiota bacterium]MDA1088488.1 right-handed parallel beta-helix repeat-containing protein [Verrucomicrobiota bacterium]